ncbi:MAG: helix-turn-helix domain-containing protein [Firmicutes bacterium]|nr:helix-turn-helix domain-containing protein [Bacillota bacterium]
MLKLNIFSRKAQNQRGITKEVIAVGVYDSIIKGLGEAVKYEKGELKNVKTDRVSIASLPRFSGKQIRLLRERQKLTQQVFANVLGVSKKTVEAWEAGKNTPNGPAQRMLYLMEKDSNLLEKYDIISLNK